MAPLNGYKGWHLFVSFLLGAVIVFGVTFLPAFGGSGRISIDRGNIGIGRACTVDTCDLDKKLDYLIRSLASFTSFTHQWTNFTEQWTEFTGNYTHFTNAVNEALSEIGEKDGVDVSDIFRKFFKNQR